MLLNCHSWFSLRYGTVSPQELVNSLLELGYTSAALTDINTTSGCIDFAKLATEAGLHPVVGVEFRVENQVLYIALARSIRGFERINRHLSTYLISGEKPGNIAPAEWIDDVWVIYPEKPTLHPLQPNEFIGINTDMLRKSNAVKKSDSDKLVVLQPFTFPDKSRYNMHRLLRAIDQNTVFST